ncbi:MAG: WecB/TagA/CpsF family glycosyltransferase [Candidatus Moraniibacteriota bacterium]|jgi:N-acetylglucosaminyldiphosphoundecaprenol N-acetyl-beta-D-mannosaminyltransferase
MTTNLQTYIFGTRIDNLSKNEILSEMRVFLSNKKLQHVTTLNPEILLKAHKDKNFRAVLNKAELNVADGIGIKFAFWRYGEHLKARYSGIDLMWDILDISNEQNLGIYLIANEDGLSTWQETRKAIQKKYPDLKINGIDVCCHPELDSGSNATKNNYTIEILNQIQDDICQNDILFVNLGAPHQELLINRLRNSKSTSLRLGIGVGGSFDYITGKVPRAPKIMRYIGFEWLYRLFKQPNRFKRIMDAVIVFPIVVLFTSEDGQVPK